MCFNYFCLQSVDIACCYNMNKVFYQGFHPNGILSKHCFINTVIYIFIYYNICIIFYIIYIYIFICNFTTCPHTFFKVHFYFHYSHQAINWQLWHFFQAKHQNSILNRLTNWRQAIVLHIWRIRYSKSKSYTAIHLFLVNKMIYILVSIICMQKFRVWVKNKRQNNKYLHKTYRFSMQQFLS